MSYVPDRGLQKPYTGYGSSNQAYSNSVQYTDSVLYVPDESANVKTLITKVDILEVEVANLTAAAVGDFIDTPDPKGLSSVGGLLHGHSASATTPGMVSVTAQEFTGVKTLTAPKLKGVYSINLADRQVTVDVDGNLGSIVSGTGGLVVGDVSAVGIPKGADLTAGILTMHVADATNAGLLSTTDQVIAGVKTLTSPKVLGVYGTEQVDRHVTIDAAGNLGSTVGASPVTLTVGAVSTTPNDNGMDITGSVISLHEAGSGKPGIVSIDAQTFSGRKTFNAPVLNNIQAVLGAASRTVTVDVSGNLGTTDTAVPLGIGNVLLPAGSNLGATIIGNYLHLFAAEGTSGGIMSTNAQNFMGAKSFNRAINIIVHPDWIGDMVKINTTRFLGTNVTGLSVFCGADTGKATGADDNTLIGSHVMPNLTTGVGNTCVGKSAGNLLAAQSLNTLVGNQAGNLSTGSENTAIGNFALKNVSGTRNIAIGSYAGFNLATGSDNICLGGQGYDFDNGAMRLGDASRTTSCHIHGVKDAVTPAFPSVVSGQMMLLNQSTAKVTGGDATKFISYTAYAEIARGGGGVITAGSVKGVAVTPVGNNLPLGNNVLVQTFGRKVTIFIPQFAVTANSGSTTSNYLLSNMSPTFPVSSIGLQLDNGILSNNGVNEPAGVVFINGTTISFNTSTNLTGTWGMAGGGIQFSYFI